MRGKQAKKKAIKPDFKYNNLVVSKFINYIMMDGKKSVASNAVYYAIKELEQKTKLQGAEAFEKAIENLKPKIELRSRRVGGANYQVPVPVPETRQLSLAMRWLINAARTSRNKSEFKESLARELFGAFNKEGAAYKKREEVHKMAEANKAFSHLTW